MRHVKRTVILCVMCIALGAAGGIEVLRRIRSANEPKEAFVYMNNQQMPNVGSVLSKLRVQNTLIRGASDCAELVTMSADLSTELILDDSYNEWSVFQKKQKIKFYGICKYATDLSGMDSSHIIFDGEKKELVVKVMKPTISSLELDFDKTEFTATETGFLRFGDIKMTSAEQNELQRAAKNVIREEALSDALMTQARGKTESVVKKYMESLLIAADLHGYSVDVIFVEAY